MNSREVYAEGYNHGKAGEVLASLKFIIDRYPKNLKGSFLRGFVRGQIEHMNLYARGNDQPEKKHDDAD
jgi:hypothetical protein